MLEKTVTVTVFNSLVKLVPFSMSKIEMLCVHCNIGRDNKIVEFVV